ncbi:MAG: hypothetical protein SFV55_21995 [Haliscomenobacter sp.]|uniref:hypothetical protein n=1 Tax=Haliscomenobacter sp. TaxID=2717303 RepID=UPI0029A8618C|nr:hypothetical protein [Haliscomenobacter sp.]MDX2071117.1 hypothetical protein [Haliscomenobacter sp.]
MHKKNKPYGLVRLRWCFGSYPQRFRRLFKRSSFQHPADFAFVLIDLFGVLDGFELINAILLKRNTRGLSDAEKFSARMVFGNAIPLDLVRIDENARIGTRSTGIVYVSGFTINGWGPFPEAILIHELVHVWQYCQQGAAYIPRALRAQRSTMGYNYGGLPALLKANHLSEFNLEQQGDLVMDYFLLLQDRQASWAPDAGAIDLPLYETFVDQIRNPT